MAARDIEPLEIILADTPVLVTTHQSPTQVCVGCLKVENTTKFNFFLFTTFLPDIDSISIILFSLTYPCCAAWLKLNPKLGLDHPTTPPQTFQLLLDMLGS